MTDVDLILRDLDEVTDKIKFQKCYSDCKDWWVITTDGKFVTSCRESFGAGSCTKKERLRESKIKKEEG